MLCTSIASLRVEPSLWHVNSVVPEQLLVEPVLKGALVTKFELEVWLVNMSTETCIHEPDRPFMYSKEEDAIVETIVAVRHHRVSVPPCVRRR